MRITVVFLLLTGAAACRAQEVPSQKPQWRGLAVSMAAHAAATGFDAWTSWQRPEHNGFLADGGRFTAQSAYRKAEIVGAVSLVEFLVVKKWGKKHPWIERACRIGNLTSAGMLTAAGVRNLGTR